MSDAPGKTLVAASLLLAKERELAKQNEDHLLDIAISNAQYKELTAARETIEALIVALEPFARQVFNDNGDMTVNTHVPSEYFIQAYFTLARAKGRK